MSDSLLQHLQTERGPVAYEDLVRDCAAMKHVTTFPHTTAELHEQLRALERAGLVTWNGDVVQAVGEQAEKTLF